MNFQRRWGGGSRRNSGEGLSILGSPFVPLTALQPQARGLGVSFFILGYVLCGLMQDEPVSESPGT